MTHETRSMSEERLNAYVDDELSPAEQAEAIARIGSDLDLKRQVCELRLLKDMMRTSYRAVPEFPEPPTFRRPGWQAVAAACLLLAGLSIGWFGRGLWLAVPEGAQVVRIDPARVDSDRVVLHIDGASGGRMQRVIDRAEQMLREADSQGRAARFELVANSQGLDLFRAKTSSEARRLAELQRRYPNLVLVGCGQTLRRLHERGEDVELLPGVQVAPAALDQIVQRLQAGWVYLKV